MRAQLASILMLVLLDPELGIQLLHPDVRPTQLGALKCCFELSCGNLLQQRRPVQGGDGARERSAKVRTERWSLPGPQGQWGRWKV